MSVAYVSAGSPIRASQLNALTAELDAVLGILLANKTPLIYGLGDAILPLGHVVAFGDSGDWKIIPLIASLFGLAEYDHTTYTTAAAALTVASYDGTLMLANVEEDDPWPLAGSLEAHKVTYLGDDYWLNQIKTGPVQGYRERYLKLAVLDVILEGMTGNLTWDAAWDKYHCIRFHNLDPVPRTVTMPGSVDIELDPFGIQAVRRTYPHANTYSTTYRYLWAAVSGDLLFWDGEPENNLGSIRLYHNILDNISSAFTSYGGTFTQVFFKPSVVWNGQSLLPQAIAGTTELYKYYYHLGRIISWTDAAGTPDPLDFTPTWASLAAGTNGIKLNIGAQQIEANTGATTPVDAVGIGSNVLPVWPTTLPQSITFVPGVIRCIGVDADTVTLDARYWDGSAFVDVSTSYSHTSLSDFAGSGDIDDTLNTHATLVSSSTSEQLSTPTVSWTSDGWRLVGYGTNAIAYTLGVVPDDDDMGYCDITETGFLQHFGADVHNRGSGTGSLVYQVASRQQGRKLSPYVGFTDIFDAVYYEGHPDLSGTYGLADGIDYVESRGTPTQSAYYRDETIGTPADTLIARVYPLEDSADEIAANAGDGTWYDTNRTRLLAGQTEVGDRQQIIRYPVLARHYNAVAQRLNAVMAIRPLTLDNVLYYGTAPGGSGLDDGTWVAAAYTDDWYCAVLSTGSRAAALGLTITGIGSGSHLTMTTAAAWAASLGLRFFVRRLSAVRRMSSGSYIRTRLTTGLYREHLGASAWLGRCVEDNSGSTPAVYLTPEAAADIPNGLAYEELLDVEHALEDGPTPPTGWQFDGQDGIMTIPRPMVNWDNDPLVAASTYEVVSEYPAAAVDASAWEAASIDNTIIDSPTVSGWYALSPVPDERTTWQIRLINRFFVVRKS